MQRIPAQPAAPRHYLRLALFVFVQFSLVGRIEAQHLRLGLTGGTGISADYATYYYPEQRVTLPDGSILFYFGYSFRSGARSAIGGPVIAWDFNDRFSVETNAIYRRLRPQGLGPTITWQFPVLARYRMPLSSGVVRPFVEIGPSFRSTGNLNTHPSHTGFAAGAGIDWNWRGFRFAPTLRYTRWTADTRSTVRSKQDQVEALFAVSRYVAGDRHPLGGRAGLGLAGGLTLLRPTVDRNSGQINPLPGNLYFTSTQSLRSWILGPRFQVDLTDRLTLVAEANYRQVRYRATSSFDFIDPSGRSAPGKRIV